MKSVEVRKFSFVRCVHTSVFWNVLALHKVRLDIGDKCYVVSKEILFEVAILKFC